MFVIGNGESRKSIDIDKLESPKVGCNAIYRDYYTNYLVCVDKRMYKEAIDADANQDRLVYTRKEHFEQFKQRKTRIVPDIPYIGMDRPDDPFHWGSGPYAVLLGAMYTKLKEVKLIGFDLYSETKTINNIYKDTPNYNDSSKRAVDPRYWIHQIGKIFNCFPKVQFIIYQDDDWQLPKAWNYPNVKVDSISNIYYNT